MGFGKLLYTGKCIINAKIFKNKLPLIVGWSITERCNKKCLYCSIGKNPSEELTTEQIFSVIDELARLGTVAVSFTGGEPLLREDIGKIIDYASGKGLQTKINSNGSLVKDKINDIKNLNRLNLSFEGPPEIHNSLRGRGSYEQVIEAAEAAVKNGIKLSFYTVLTKVNIDSIDFILKKAKEFNTNVYFQPATENILGGTAPNPVTPSKEKYKKAIEMLIFRKKKGENIANSISGLKHLYHWPGPKKIKCACGFISCRIQSNGDVIYCSREDVKLKPLNCIRDGFKKAFENLDVVSCSQCWCGPRVDLNLLFSFNLKVILNQIKNI
ncbi:MAG: radical SAM protein [Elusimicrobia bacterium]|nr:radical SAM protein [Elusimicrobiota bacterium]